MKQVTQRLRDGRIDVTDVPTPALSPHGVLVRVRASLLSAGTERTKVETGRQNLVQKARSRPDQVQQVLAKAQRDGVRSTVDAVRTRLEQPSSLGYSAAGDVLAIGHLVRGVSVGDRVACAGADYAVHAEIDHVPASLCVAIPDELSYEEAAFTTVGAIALHGVRQADVRLGEKVCVVGLGLVGQISCQLLQAAGCQVAGVDLAADLVKRALESGAAHAAFTRGSLDKERLPEPLRDADAVIITAGTTSDDPIELAAALARDRGKVVVVGAVGMQVPRAPYYSKEIDLRFSRSYGPGRYDTDYEERGLDYPIGYVRWTERRNLASFVDLAARRRIAVAELITERLPVEQAPEAYNRLVDGSASPLGIILTYSGSAEVPAPPPRRPRSRLLDPRKIGVIGAGNFAQGTLIPAFKQAGFSLEAVASAAGLSARGAEQRFGFGRATDVDDVLQDPSIGTVVIATRHDTHASLALAALEAGKHVFVEKPPALTLGDLAQLEDAANATGLKVLVGFNRRHAPLALRLREHLRQQAVPVELLYRINAGLLPADHWLNDVQIGGGRLVGEGCHFIDWACWFVGELPERVNCTLVPERAQPTAAAQSFAVNLRFHDGSLATVSYGTAGATTLGKERIEVHGGTRSGILYDFKSATLMEGRTRLDPIRAGADKGHSLQAVAAREILTGERPDPVPDHLATMRATFDALTSEVGLLQQTDGKLCD